MVEGVVDNGKAAEMLRIHFSGQADESLDDISWELFFKIFDNNNLAFLYQENNMDGELSKFCKFVFKK